MSLKDLQAKLSQRSIHSTPIDIIVKQRLEISYTDTDVACDIVDHIFNYINLCLKEDKSKVKLSLFAKSFIRGILTDNLKDAINNFIKNMPDKETRSLLDDIQTALNKRVV